MAVCVDSPSSLWFSTWREMDDVGNFLFVLVYFCAAESEEERFCEKSDGQILGKMMSRKTIVKVGQTHKHAQHARTSAPLDELAESVVEELRE
jgi:hypothetical protein